MSLDCDNQMILSNLRRCSFPGKLDDDADQSLFPLYQVPMKLNNFLDLSSSEMTILRSMYRYDSQLQQLQR